MNLPFCLICYNNFVFGDFMLFNTCIMYVKTVTNELELTGSLFKDFEKFGVYDAQARLEMKHRKEEDELYRQIVDERHEQMERLEEVLRLEKERTVKELIAWFEEHGAAKKEKEDGLEKVNSTYLTQ